MPPREQRGGRGASRGGRGGPTARGGPAARGGQPAQAPPAHISTVGVRRPGYGNSGKPMTININSFTATILDGSIYHYDVIASENLPAAMNQRLIKALQFDVAQSIFTDARVVFDGRKNLFSAVELDLGGNSREFDVSLPSQTQQTQNDRPPRIYKIRLTHVATINTETLHRFIDGLQSQDNTVNTTLMALNVVIRMEPSQRFPVKGRSFFTPDDTRNLGGGLVLWRGYFQSIRPALNRMLINVDISTGVMYQSGPLISLCLSFLGMDPRNPSVLSQQLPDRQRVALGRFITGIRVQTKNAGSGVERTQVVRKLSPQAADKVTFTMRGGETLTVAAYFRKVNNKPLMFPSLLCVEVGQGALIPLELCTVIPGQLVRKEVPDDKKTALVEFATMRPKDRFASIQKGLDVLAYGQSEYVRKFGITVDRTPLQTQARVLAAPALKYGAGSTALTVNPRNGSWNMAGTKFYKPASIAAWVLIIFESMGRFNDQAVNDVATSFVKGCRATGMTVTHPDPIVRRINGQAQIAEQLLAAGAACAKEKKVPPSLFVVVLPEGGNDIYTMVKHWGDIKKGVATQCLKSRKCRGAKEQFWANVALKVNVKLGGINVITDSTQVAVLSDPHNNPTVVMGADVMHPGAGTTNRPSFAAVVSSVDSNAAKYVATMKVQASRQELISDLQEMTHYLLSKFMDYRKLVEGRKEPTNAPKRLIFYRDGVSEGQFQQVLDQGKQCLDSAHTDLIRFLAELPLIRAACDQLKIKPKITLVVVGKRHHVRLFPSNDRDADRSGNCPAGTVVDRDIGHPTEFDFYLQSHGGLLGTSRPAHYSVLYDENSLTADTMQALSFALCHVYAGSTRSVSIPAPVYYADTVCARAKIHFDPEKQGYSETHSGTADSADLENYKRDYQSLHQLHTTRMYFS